jgi:hypothetical protein
MRYLKVNLENNFVKDKDGNVIEAGFIYPGCWDAYQINVRAYKGLDGGGAEYCRIETNNTMAKNLLDSGKATEYNQ